MLGRHRRSHCEAARGALAALVLICAASPDIVRADPSHAEEQQAGKPQGERGPSGVAPAAQSQPNPSADQGAADSKNADDQPLTLSGIWRHWLHSLLLDPLVLFTLVLAGSTIFLWLETRRLARGAEGQAEDMKASIAEAARSATAMEAVAVQMAASAATAVETVKALKSQMRAYVTVDVGGATYQDRPNALRFAGSPQIKNTGITPAKNLHHWIKAEIIRAEADDFHFSPGAFREDAPFTLEMHQHQIITAPVSSYIPDQDVENTKLGVGHRLIVWGMIAYEDIFGQSHYRRFGLCYTWLGDGSVLGAWTRKHNDSD